MYKVFLFAGTTEGRELAEFLSRAGVEVFVFTATEYGKSLIGEAEHMVLSPERLSAEEMEEQIRIQKPDLVVDATHPYAEIGNRKYTVSLYPHPHGADTAGKGRGHLGRRRHYLCQFRKRSSGVSFTHRGKCSFDDRKQRFGRVYCGS